MWGRRFLGALGALALVASGCTPSAAPPAAWKTVSLADYATVRVPRGWFVTPYRGEQATVYFRLVTVSSSRSIRATPDHGVVASWGYAEFPVGGGWRALPGAPTTIDDRPAKISSGPATSSCPRGAATEIDAYVRRVTGASYPGEWFDLPACLGRLVNALDRSRVKSMLFSLRATAR